MFTGLIQKVSPVIHLRESAVGRDILVNTRYPDLLPGESISVNGVCLTVETATPSGEARFHLSLETLERSSLRNLTRESKVNLERSLRADDRLGGHWVQGHVDGVATCLSVTPVCECLLARFSLSRDLGRYCVEKGSISVDGVSLTINKIRDISEEKMTEFEVMLVPHTFQNTTLQDLKVGDLVNIETDILAKYVERLLKKSDSL